MRDKFMRVTKLNSNIRNECYYIRDYETRFSLSYNNLHWIIKNDLIIINLFPAYFSFPCFQLTILFMASGVVIKPTFLS